jgi:hypothetical protein
MPLETVGALRPESRTRSAFEHGSCSYSSCRRPRALVCRSCEGREGMALADEEEEAGKPDGNEKVLLTKSAHNVCLCS